MNRLKDKLAFNKFLEQETTDFYIKILVFHNMVYSTISEHFAILKIWNWEFFRQLNCVDLLKGFLKRSSLPRSLDRIQLPGYVTVLLVCVSNITVYGQSPAQTVRIPTPETAAMAKYINFPIDLMTGMQAVNINLYTIELKGISFPISLNYTASAGMKPGDVSGSIVGVGWNLKAEPMISRKINSKPDEGGGGYLNNTRINQGNTWEYYKQITTGSVEEDPDKFYYQMISHSGKFYFSKESNGDRSIKSIPFKSIKLDHEKSYGFNQLMLYDEDGTEYFYGLNENGYGALESTVGSITDRLCWKAARIHTPKTDENIYFKYYDKENMNRLVQGTDYNFRTFVMGCGEFNFADPGCSDPCDPNCLPQYRLSPVISSDINGYQSEVTLNQNNELTNDPITCNTHGNFNSYIYAQSERRLIKEIIMPNGKIEFTIDPFSLNEGSRLLRKITVYAEGKKMKELNFIYSNEHYLKSIEITDENNVKQQGYNFKYIDTDLAGNGTLYENFNAVDYWGFNNGTGNTGLVPFQSVNTTKDTMIGYSRNIQDISVLIGNADREPNENAAKKGVLEEIIYPTGGSTKFEYEMNQYRTVQGEIKSGGGIRLKSIVNKSLESEIQKRYTYGENEDGVGNLRQGIDLSNYAYEYIERYYPGENVFNPYTYYSSKITHYTSGILDMFYENGSAVVYNKITEYVGDKNINSGKSEYFYQTDNFLPYRIPGSNMVVENTYSGVSGRLIGTKDYENVGGTYQLIKNKTMTHNFYNMGLVASGRKIYERYRFLNLPSNFEHELRFSSNANCPLPSVYETYQIAQLNYNSYVERISDESETLYTGTGEITTVKHYDYNNLLLPGLPTTVSLTNSNNQIITDNFYYLDDALSQSVSLNLSALQLSNLNAIKQKNMLNYLVCSKKTSATATIVSKNTPDIKGNTIISESIINGQQVALDKFTYDANGGILQHQKSAGIKTCYIWSYRALYPIARIDNIELNTITSLMGGQGIIDVLRAQPDPDVDSYLGSLRSILPKGAQITSYTYKPLVGMTSSTDAKGMTSYYEYDAFQRLKAVKDQNGNILKQTDYHYKN